MERNYASITICIGLLIFEFLRKVLVKYFAPPFPAAPGANCPHLLPISNATDDDRA